MANFTTIRIQVTSSDELAVIAASRHFCDQHPGCWVHHGYVVASFVDEDGNRWADVTLHWLGDL
jgi:hypothetical protein